MQLCCEICDEGCTGRPHGSRSESRRRGDRGSRPRSRPRRSDRSPRSIPGLESWPTPPRAARKRAQTEVCRAVSVIEALDSGVRGDRVLTQLAELPDVGYSFKPCTDGDELAVAPLLTHCLSDEAGFHLAVLTAYRFIPVIARKKTENGEVDLFAPDVRASLANRANNLALVESNLWFLASLGDADIVTPYAVRYDLAHYAWDPQQPGHILCLRCASHTHYRRQRRAETPRDGRCRHCSRGRPDDWPTHATEPHTRGTWWLRCQTPDCPNTYVGRANQLRCPHCRLNRTTPAQRKQLPH
jgi:hypothetical protein